MAQHLTDAIVKRLPAPAKGNKITYDSDVAGFGIRVTANGARSFVLGYRVRGTGRERRYTIGGFPDWRVTEARSKARELKREIDDGGDPLGDIEAERAAPTVADLIERFEEEWLPRKRESTREDYRRMIRVWIKPHLRNRKVAEVTHADVDALHRKITKAGYKHRANRTIAVLSKMFSLAVRWSMRTDNPCRGIERNTEHHRQRYLKGDELARLVAALAKYPDQQAANVIRMLLLTGARRGEVLGMRWADLDLSEGVWSKEPSSTKQNEPHEVPLSAPARALLAEIAKAAGKKALPTFVFPSHSAAGHHTTLKRPWRQLTKAAGITGLRIHDLRHSFASQLASGGASLPLIGALLGHSNPATTHRYAHLFIDPQRAAAERVGAIVTAAGKPVAEPVRIKGARP